MPSENPYEPPQDHAGRDRAVQRPPATKLSVFVLWCIRLVLASGIVVVSYCAVFRGATGDEEWIHEAVVQSCYLVGGITVAISVMMELLALALRRTALRVWMLLVAIAAMTSPWLYVLPARLMGSEIAEIETWHLLPLFAVFHLIFATLASGLISGILVALYCWLSPKVSAIRRGRQDYPAKPIR